MPETTAPSQLLLPNRYFFRLGVDAPVDKYGLLLEDGIQDSIQRSEAFGLADFPSLPHKNILVVGPAYSGKSYTIDLLRKWLRTKEDADDILHTDARTIGAFRATVEPQGWSTWKDSSRRAIWFVDSLEEAAVGHNVPGAIVEQLSTLSSEALSRLRLVVTCRENEIPSNFESRIAATTNEAFFVVRIGAPSHSEAVSLCGEANIARVLQVLVENNLESISENPAVLIWLSRQPTTIGQTMAEVWRGVVEELLDRDYPAHRRARTSLSDRFSAACRLAFVLEFSDIDGLTLSGPPEPSLPHLDSLFDDEESQLLDAAREATLSPLFRIVGRTTRIHSRHLREWLAAWQLAKLAVPGRWEQIRELIDEPELTHWSGATVAALLNETLPPGAPFQLRRWLREQQVRFAIGLVSNLVKAADASPGPIDTPTRIIELRRRLTSESLNAALTDAIAHWSRHSINGKQFILSIAEQLRSPVLRDFAWSVLRDSDSGSALREDALAYLRRIGEPLRIPELLATLGEPPTKDNERLRTALLRYGLLDGVIPVSTVFRKAPRPDDNLGDIRWLLAHEIGERLDIETSLEILESQSRDSYDYLGEKAIEQLVSRPESLNARRILSAFEAAYARSDWHRKDQWSKVISSGPHLRRAIYAIHTDSSYTSDVRHLVPSLHKEDIEWLVEFARAKGYQEAHVANLYWLVEGRDDAATIRERLSEGNPEVVRRIRLAVAERESMQAELHERRRSPPRLQLRDVLDEILNDTSSSPEVQLRNLGWVAFTQSQFRPGNIDGKFDELSDAFRNTVLERLSSLVRHATPTPVPEGNSIPAAVMSEGEAVEAAFRAHGVHAFDAQVLAKWLPTLLRGLDNDLVLGLVSDVIPAQSVHAFLEFIRRDATTEDRSAFTAARAPPSLWALGLSSGVENLLLSDSLPEKGRAALIHEMRRQSPTTATHIALTWLNRNFTSDALVSAAIRVVFWTRPHDAIRWLSQDAKNRGATAILAVIDEFDRWDAGRGVTLADWEESALIAFLELIFDHFPEDEDPQHEGAHFVTSRDEVSDIRWRCVNLLVERWLRGSDTAHLALKSVATQSAKLAKTIRWHEANKQADAIIHSAANGSRPPEAPRTSSASMRSEPSRRRRLSVKQVLTLLRLATFRVPRSAAELHRVVVEALKRIESDVREDLALFFPKGFRNARSSEDALQTYVCRRLSDLMPGNIVERESWVPLNRKVDLLIQLKTADGLTHLAVPLEIKWSDDPRTPTAASEQLAARYMLSSKGRSHGIYLVAWTGTSRPAGLGSAGLRHRLTTDLAKLAVQSPAIRVRIVWWNVDPST